MRTATKVTMNAFTRANTCAPGRISATCPVKSGPPSEARTAARAKDRGAERSVGEIFSLSCDVCVFTFLKDHTQAQARTDRAHQNSLVSALAEIYTKNTLSEQSVTTRTIFSSEREVAVAASTWTVVEKHSRVAILRTRSMNSSIEPDSGPDSFISRARARETIPESATSAMERARRTATSSEGDVSASSPVSSSSSASLKLTATARSDPTLENAVVAIPLFAMEFNSFSPQFTALLHPPRLPPPRLPLPQLPLPQLPQLPPPLPEARFPSSPEDSASYDDADTDICLRRENTLLPVRPWTVVNERVVWGVRKSALVSFIGGNVEDTAKIVEKLMGLLASRAECVQSGGAFFEGDKTTISDGVSGLNASRRCSTRRHLRSNEVYRGAGRLKMSKVYGVSVAIAVCAMAFLQRGVVVNMDGLAAKAIEILEEADCTVHNVASNAVERRLLARGVVAMRGSDSCAGEVHGDTVSRQRRKIDAFLRGLFPNAVVGLATQASLLLALSQPDTREDGLTVKPTASAIQQLDAGRNVRLRTDDGSSSVSSYASVNSASSLDEFYDC